MADLLEGRRHEPEKSEKGYVYLPVTLKVGESLESVFPNHNKKQVVYVNLETASGVWQFKIDY